MFENDRSVQVDTARKVRMAFGLVMIAGAVVLVGHVCWEVIDPAVLVPLTWACAFAAGALVRIVGSRPVTAERLRARFEPSIVLPSVGIALMLPLTLHLPVVAYTVGAHEYREWVRLSIIITGLTHVAVAALAGVRGRQLVAGEKPISIKAIYVTGVAVSCVPFALLNFIPPVLVALTGLAFIPLLVYQRRLVERERVVDVAIPQARLVS